MSTEIVILAALLTKHIICDFPLQTPYQFTNKGTYGHAGGLLHAGIHGFGTFFALIWFAPLLLILKLALLDALIHYHIDWVKNKINRRYNLKPSNGQGFWITFGLDQYFHQITYLVLCLQLT